MKHTGGSGEGASTIKKITPNKGTCFGRLASSLKEIVYEDHLYCFSFD